MSDLIRRDLADASNGQPRPIIGRGFSPLYALILKVTLAGVVGAVLVGGLVRAAVSGGALGDAALKTLGLALSGGFIAVGAVTVVFGLLERSPAGTRVLADWEAHVPPGLIPPIRLRQTNWVHHLGAVMVQTIFLLAWTGAIGPWPLVIPVAGQSLGFDLAPVWQDLHGPVLGVLLGAIAVNALSLVPGPGRRLGRGLDPLLQLAIAAVAVLALRAGPWISISGFGMDAASVSEIDRGANIAAEAGLIAIAAVAAFQAGAQLLQLVRGCAAKKVSKPRA